MNQHKLTSRVARRAAVAALLVGAAAGAFAQYKIVGPDGKVTYTDKPPAGASIQPPRSSAGSSDDAAGMPYETRQAMARYPVTLYTTPRSCPACDQARQALRERGVPFSEYTISTESDLAALQSRFGDTSAPTIAIGSQAVKGFSATALSSYLDAAGYPAQARLTGYRWPPALPLTTPAPVAAAPKAAAPAAAPSSPASPPPSNSGIQF